MRRKFFAGLLTLVICVFTVLRFPIFAQTVTPTPTPTSDDSQQAQDLQNTINSLESKISDLQGQEKTLSSQIDVFDSQINLTEARITQTQQKILDLTLDIDTASKKVDNLNKSLQDLTKVLLDRITATYEVGQAEPIQILLSSKTVSDLSERANYLKIVQAHDKELIYETEQAKNDYANQKTIFENEKKQVEVLKQQLTTYSDQLDQQKAAKQDLLTQTQGSESVYQQELSAAKAQLAGFSNFVTANGGASILSNQTVCDGWGCYYNQRDSQWGNIVINGSNDCGGACSVALVGCLLTSVAMVASHNGHKDILPSDIALSGGSNFAVGTAELRKGTISVKGVSITRNTIGGSSAAIPSTITDPVIVGISYDGGPIADHFVVLVSGSSGNYTMNDPFVAGGHNIPFSSHYSLGSIVEVDTISM